MGDYYIGLMSGTSLDAADGVLIDFSGPKIKVVASATQTFLSDFSAELLALNTPGSNEVHRTALAASQLVVAYAAVVASLLRQATLTAPDIRAVGAHGQTIRHQPAAGYSVQLNNPALLAELTGIDVVADFRSRDVAAGGQGAPLVPAFHQRVFGQAGQTTLVLNVGGMSNLSVLSSSGDVLGFDCGPGNVLLDAWCLQHTGKRYDEGGRWAASGKIIPKLLASLLDEPYLALPPPKSTGRDLFSLEWLAAKLAPFAAQQPEDVQASLSQFTASTCVYWVKRYLNDSKELIVCGGGAFNHDLVERLTNALPLAKVVSSSGYGLPALQVEAAAFAWLARQTINRQPGNLPSVTGAAGLRILGAIYPA